MTDPTLAKADLYDQISDLTHPKCTLVVVSAIVDKRVSKNQAAGMTLAQAVQETHTALSLQNRDLRRYLGRAG